MMNVICNFLDQLQSPFVNGVKIVTNFDLMEKLLRYRELNVQTQNGPNIVDIVGTLSRASLPGSECCWAIAHCYIFLNHYLPTKATSKFPGNLLFLPRDNTRVNGMILVP